MKIAALIVWLVTAFGGFFLLGTWLKKGGVRQQQAGISRLPAPVIFGHFLLAVAGLVVWIIYLAIDKDALAWAALAILVLVALLGFTMFFRWIPVYRARTSAAAGEEPAERHFPIAIVLGHGLLGAITLLLVLLTALGIGGS